MYLRFVTNRLDKRTQQKEGMFTCAYDWQDYLKNWEHDYLKELLLWFTKNMPIPKKFSRRKIHQYKDGQGISWFKDIGDREIETKLWELKSFLETKGEKVDIIKTKNPGYVVYQDECQVVAEPMSDTFNL